MSSPPRILILGAGPLCRNPRVLKEATTLARAGFDVTVTAIAYSERFEAFDRELLRDAPFRMSVLNRMSRKPAARLASIGERLLRWLACRAIRVGVESPRALGPYRALLALAQSHPADLTIVHTELPFCIGAELLRQGRRVAADFEDWHSRDLLPGAQAHRPLRLLATAEGELLRRAAYCSAPSEAMAQALQSAYGGAGPIFIPNTFPLQPKPPARPRQAPPSFLWFSQTIGPGRGLEAFLEAWVRTTAESRVVLLGDIVPDYRESLLRLVPSGLRARLSFHAIVSPTELPAVIAAHDVGLALEPEKPESRFLTITNKIFQYLNAGLAVAATPTAGQLEVLAQVPGCGIKMNTADPAGTAAQLDSMLTQPGRLAAMGAAARAGAEHYYCWERAEERLIATVQAALRPKGPPHEAS